MIGPRVGIRPVPGREGIAVGLGEDQSAPNQAQTTLSVVLADSADPVNGDTNFNYTVVVANTGGADASNVVSTLTLDASLTFVSNSGTGWSFSRVGQVVTATRSTLATGATAPTITVTVTPTNADAVVTSTATADADNSPAATPDSENTTINSVTTLTAVLADSADPVMTSENYNYTAVVTNTGSVTANNVTATIVCPTNSTFVSASGTGWTCNNSGHAVTCTRSALAPGAAPTITVTVTGAAAAETSSATLDADADNTSPATQDTETTGILLVSLDAASGKRCPASATEWTNVGTLVGFTLSPFMLWLCQEPSGNLADSIDSHPTSLAFGLNYQQAVTAWTRVAVTLDDATDDCARITGAAATTLPNVASESFMVLWYGDFPGSHAAADMQACLLGANPHAGAILRTASTSNASVQFDVLGLPTLISTNVGGQVRPFLIQIDRTNSANRACVDIGIAEPAFQGGLAGQQLYIGSGLSPNESALYVVGFRGSNAEPTRTQIKTMLQKLGWTVTWTP